ncbi:MAG: LacI family DNA-binding transcriptional regulator [Thermoplasmata archaeon]|nr:MAG: LacI family DNA-binding transcriptional regulator [Thermoplasmata archaeon]
METMSKVAKAASVSLYTVSKVLNGMYFQRIYESDSDNCYPA